MLAGLVGFVVIAALWWIYFDVGADKSADDLAETEAAEAEPSDDAVDERHDLFVYGHLPMTFGIVLAGVGLEELVLHPDTPAPSAYGWLLAGGAVLFLLGIVMVVGGTARSWRSVWPWPLAALPLLPVVAALPVLTSTSLLGVTAAVLVGIAVVGTAAGPPQESTGVGGTPLRLGSNRASPATRSGPHRRDRSRHVGHYLARGALALPWPT